MQLVYNTFFRFLSYALLLTIRPQEYYQTYGQLVLLPLLSLYKQFSAV
jgi:hypothetical protein